jgi:hypothetical protein
MHHRQDHPDDYFLVLARAYNHISSIDIPGAAGSILNSSGVFFRKENLTRPRVVISPEK